MPPKASKKVITSQVKKRRLSSTEPQVKRRRKTLGTERTYITRSVHVHHGKIAIKRLSASGINVDLFCQSHFLLLLKNAIEQYNEVYRLFPDTAKKPIGPKPTTNQKTATGKKKTIKRNRDVNLLHPDTRAAYSSAFIDTMLAIVDALKEQVATGGHIRARLFDLQLAFERVVPNSTAAIKHSEKFNEDIRVGKIKTNLARLRKFMSTGFYFADRRMFVEGVLTPLAAEDEVLDIITGWMFNVIRAIVKRSMACHQKPYQKIMPTDVPATIAYSC